MKIDGPRDEAVQVLHAPVGYIDFLRPCRDGFILKIVANDRVGDIYVVNSDDWTVERVASMGWKKCQENHPSRFQRLTPLSLPANHHYPRPLVRQVDQF